MIPPWSPSYLYNVICFFQTILLMNRKRMQIVKKKKVLHARNDPDTWQMVAELSPTASISNTCIIYHSQIVGTSLFCCYCCMSTTDNPKYGKENEICHMLLRY